jgi:hypothetical protein
VLASVETEMQGGDLTIRHQGGDRLRPADITVIVDGANRTTHRLSDLDGIDAEDRFTAGSAATLRGAQAATGEVRVTVVHEPTNTILH